MRPALIFAAVVLAALVFLVIYPGSEAEVKSSMSGKQAVAAEAIKGIMRKAEGTSGILPIVAEMPANPVRSKYPVVVLDPGHGTRDKDGKITGQGASGKFKGREVPEEGLTLDYGMWLQAELRRLGIPCHSTRTYDKPWFDVDYQGHDQEANNKLRAEFATALDAALFVRIHFDGSADSASSGFSVWYNDMSRHDSDGSIERGSIAAAEAVRARLAEAMAIKDLGLLRFERPIYGFVHAEQPSILLELAFLSSASDTAYVLKEETLRDVSLATALGIRDYLDARAR